VGVGVRVGKGVKVGIGVGVPRRGGTSVSAKLRPIVMMTSRLIIQNMMRFRWILERRTIPPVGGCYLAFHYSTALWRHKREPGSGAVQLGGGFGAICAGLEEPALGRVQQQKAAQRFLFTVVRLVATEAAHVS
jgi:hypothetical protein